MDMFGEEIVNTFSYGLIRLSFSAYPRRNKFHFSNWEGRGQVEINGHRGRRQKRGNCEKSAAYVQSWNRRYDRI